MKGPIFSKVKWILGGLLLIAYAQNCTKADFTEAPPGPTFGSAQGNPDGPVETEIPTQPAPTPTPTIPTTPSGTYPKLDFDYEYCAPNTDCEKTMLFDHADARAIMLKWKTNEFRAAANPTTLCQPNTGYVPKTGSVTFAPGEVAKTIIVRQLTCDINQTIPIQVTECYANGVQFDCNELQ